MTYYKIAFITCLFLASCEYSPQGFYDVQVKEPPNPPAITINLNNNGNPMDLAMPYTFEFSISLASENIYSVDVFFDNSNIYSTDLNQGNFVINPKNFSNGNYILEFKVYSKTHTNSLADAFGAEVYVYTQKWNIMIDNTLQPINIKSINPESGSLVISWEKYTRPNFIKYDLFKISNSGTHLCNTFTNQEITSFFDNEYIGGTCSYYINIVTESDSKESEHKIYSDSLPKILSVVSESGNTVIKWSRCKYSANFYQYVLFKNSPYYWSDAIYITYSPNDTVCVTTKIASGVDCNFYLKTAPQNYYAGLTDYFNACKGNANAIIINPNTSIP